MGNLKSIDRKQRLVMALGAKAKSDPSYRFYSLYDKVSDPDILKAAYKAAKRNDGAPGIDGETFES
ncbi:MAG: hypothetical protein LBG48_01985, partial [Rickettsiales bacterium]|nr:hypothetical protein [Rickettsiales bacterium]